MTHFVDGPARAQNLMLRRAPFLLRVSEKAGEFDALDLPEDEPFDDEKLHAYVLAGKPSMCHLRIAKPGRSGFYTMALYKHVEPQPADADMRTREAWTTWCRLNAERLGWKQR